MAYTDSDGDADDGHGHSGPDSGPDSRTDSGTGAPEPDCPSASKWQAWRPEVPLVTLPSARRSLAKPIVRYLRQLEAEDKHHRLVVLIPEVQPTGRLQWLLHNQRGIILEHAIRRGTANVVLCRLRYRLETLTADPAGADAASGR